MKQLGLALQNHHDVHKRFPATSNQGNPDGVASVWWPAPGSAADTGEIPSAGYNSEAALGTTSATAGYSWIVMILPYLDEQKLFDTIAEASGDFAADAFTPYNVEGVKDGQKTGQTFSVSSAQGSAAAGKHFAAVELDAVNCPSYWGSRQVTPSDYSGKPGGDPPPAYGYPKGSARLGASGERAAISNYLAMSATHFTCMQYAKQSNLAATTTIPDGAQPPNGMLVPGTGLSLKDCFDGASRTVMLCETIEPAMNSWYDGTTAWTTALNPNTVVQFPPNKMVNANNPLGFWSAPPGSQTAINIGPMPNKSVAYCPALAGYAATPRVVSWGPSSNHTGNVVLHTAVDGSVHFVVLDIDPNVYMHFVTRAGREPESIESCGPVPATGRGLVWASLAPIGASP